jgi:hypothetical protein
MRGDRSLQTRPKFVEPSLGMGMGVSESLNADGDRPPLSFPSFPSLSQFLEQRSRYRMIREFGSLQICPHPPAPSPILGEGDPD